MKSLSFILCLVVLISIQSCKKEKEQRSFDFEKMSGIWVPYQSVHPDGTIYNGPFTAGNIFGTYEESVQINNDCSFIPVTWMDSNDIRIRQEEKGTVSYLCDTKKLVFSNTSQMEFEVIKDGDELWLKKLAPEPADIGTLFKLERK